MLDKESIESSTTCSNCSPPQKSEKKYNYSINVNGNKLIIQEEKVKLFVFDANSTKAMLQKFKDTIKKHSSEFRFLPEEDRIQEDFVQETYSIDYSDTINKLRSIDKYQLDRFKISSYLAKQLMLAKYSTNNECFNKTKQELLFAFNGRMGLDLFLFWDKVLTYFVLNKNDEAFCEFVTRMLNNIKRINYKNEKVQEKIKDELINYLKESIYLSLSLNPNFIYKNNNINNCFILKNTFNKLMDIDDLKKIFEKNIYIIKINQLITSVMIKHKYCFMPILNYTQKKDNEFIDFTDENILGRKEIPNLISDDNKKIIFNPKRFSFEEIMLYENYQTIKNFDNNSKAKNISNNIKLKSIMDDTIDKYIILNLKQFKDSQYYESKKSNLKHYFQTLNKKENSRVISLNINKEKFPPKLSNLKVGLYNTKISNDSISNNLKIQQKLTFNELQDYIKFLNLAIQNNKTKCDLIVFPEVCIPYQALGLLSDFSKKNKIAIICGLKHITINEIVYNCIATILPFSIGYYTDSYINLRIKEWYSPSEIKEIKKVGKKIPPQNVSNDLINNLFCWNNLYFAVYDCFELADVKYRSEFKSEVDLIIACEWNKDIDYFDNIIKATSRDLHCYVIQANTSQYGDSKILAPKTSREMTLLNIKGGEDNILIGYINIEALRNFQRKETEYLDDNDKVFKPLPPDFNKKTERLDNINLEC